MSILAATTYTVTCDHCHEPISAPTHDVNTAIAEAMGRGRYAYNADWGRKIWECGGCAGSVESHRKREAARAE